MAKRRNRNRRNIGWVKTDVKATAYKSMQTYVNAIFRDNRNYGELLRRLELNTPGIFTAPESMLFGKKQDKKAILRFVASHARGTQDAMTTRRNPHPTKEQAIKKALNTRAYVSNEELIQNNLKDFLNKHEKGRRKMRKELMKQLGVKRWKDVPWENLVYNKEASIKLANGKVEKAKIYGFKGTDVAYELLGSGSKQSPYIFVLVSVKDVVF